MVTTGSKYFFSLFGLGLLAAVVYGIISNGVGHGGIINVISGPGAVDAITGPLTLGYKGGVGDHLGYTILMGFALANFGLGFASSAFRDGDAGALAELNGDDVVPAIVAPTALSYWPLVMSFGAALVVIGLVTSSVTFTIGCVVIILTGVEWTISAWAEAQTADPELNAAIRRRLMSPIEIPGSAVIGIGAVVFCVSRAFLMASEEGAVWVALAMLILVLAVALIASARPQLRRTAVIGVLLVAGLAILAIGITGTAVGPRQYERHGFEPGAEQVKPGLVINHGPDSAVRVIVGETS